MMRPRCRVALLLAIVALLAVVALTMLARTGRGARVDLTVAAIVRGDGERHRERPRSGTEAAPGGPLLDAPTDQLPVVGDYAWNRPAASNGGAAALLWLLVIELLGLLVLPLTLQLFRSFPDRGWGLSKLVGWLLLGYPLWLGASLRIAPFTLPVVLFALSVGLGLAAAAAHRWRVSLRAILGGAGPAIALSEGVFLLAGVAFLALRVRNPDLWHTYWGGEKPMELAHLNAILRSAYLPPYDPWFAGGTINYYYFGHYLVALPVKLTGLPAEVAFNLAMPTVSALVAGAAFSVAAGLATFALRRRTAFGPLAFGLLGAALFVGVGNLAGPAQLVRRARAGDGRPLGFEFFWNSSRAVTGAITEFPFFTQLWADLHAHAIALPFTILAVGLVVALASARREEPELTRDATGASARAPVGTAPHAPPSAHPPYLAALALVIGALACTNSWDVPVYLLVVGAGLFLATGPTRRPLGGGEIARRLAVAVAGTALVGLAAYLLYWPFFRSFQAQFNSPARTRTPTAPLQYLEHFGLFIVVVAATLTAGFLLHARGRGLLLGAGIVFAMVAGSVGLWATALTAWLATHTRFFADEVPASGRPVSGTGTVAALLAALAVLLATLWVVAWREHRLQLPLIFLVAATGVTLGPEIVFLADDLLGSELERLNTVFKFYFQAWTLFAFGGIGALAWLYDTAPRWSRAPFRRVGRRVARRNAARAVRGAVAGALGSLLLCSLVYPVVATPLRLAERSSQPVGLAPTLDGHRWMEYGLMPGCATCAVADGGAIGFQDDLAAIRWLNATISGTPTIAEASIGAWRGNGARFANATGLPTILGWDHHVAQQRPAASVAPRVADVRALYNEADEGAKLAILRRYRVSYVIVGAVERGWCLSPEAGDTWASPEGLATLEGLAGRFLTPAFRSGDTVVYRVLPAVWAAGDIVAPDGGGEGARR